MDLSSNSGFIRDLCCRLGWCRSDLAFRLGVSSSVVRAWESGEQKPSAVQSDVLESLFRQTETSVLEIQQAPFAEKMLESQDLETLNLRDLARERGDR